MSQGSPNSEGWQAQCNTPLKYLTEGESQQATLLTPSRQISPSRHVDAPEHWTAARAKQPTADIAKTLMQHHMR